MGQDELTSEIKYRQDILKSANNIGELNELKHNVFELLGGQYQDQDGEIDFAKIPMMDLIMIGLNHNPIALQDILSYANISLSNNLLIDSIISHLELKGLSSEEIEQSLSSLGIIISADRLNDDETFEVQHNQEFGDQLETEDQTIDLLDFFSFFENIFNENIDLSNEESLEEDFEESEDNIGENYEGETRYLFNPEPKKEKQEEVEFSLPKAVDVALKKESSILDLPIKEISVTQLPKKTKQADNTKEPKNNSKKINLESSDSKIEDVRGLKPKKKSKAKNSINKDSKENLANDPKNKDNKWLNRIKLKQDNPSLGR